MTTPEPPDDGLRGGSPAEPRDGAWDEQAEPLLAETAGGGFDLSAMLSSAMEMQSQLSAAQAEATSAVVEGHAGGGVVRVEVTGGFQFRSVTIDPSAVDGEDVELLQDLVLAALNDATAKIDALQQQSLGGLGDLLGGADAGGGLGELGGMLGISPDTSHLLLDDESDDDQVGDS